MTDRHIMTHEEAAQLPMPEGCWLTYSERDHEWLYSGEGGSCTGLAILAATVADGYLPREVLDHAWAVHRGEEWLRNPRVAEKFKARGLRITELEQQLGYERAKRSQAETRAAKAELQLADAWTEERKQAALELARCVIENDRNISAVRARLCAIVTCEEIKPCPRCGGRCSVRNAMSGHHRTECDGTMGAGCWHGPPRHSSAEAIAAHNAECAKLGAK